MVTPEEHYVEDTEKLSKQAKKFEEKGQKPETTEEYKERMRNFNKKLMDEVKGDVGEEEEMPSARPKTSKKAAASEEASASE